MSAGASSRSPMRAARAHAGRLEVDTVAPPERGPGDAGLAIVRPTSVCFTSLELEVLRGLGRRADAEPAAPGDGHSVVLGHAFVGVVEEPAATPGALARGTRVAVQPVRSCGACERCRGGIGLLCAARSIAGIDPEGGGLAERTKVPETSCVELPRELDDDRAAFAVPLARAIEAVRRGGVARRTFASVLGDDLVAILATIVALEENPLARLVARHPSTLGLAERFGIRHRALHETGRRGDQELVIETSGSAESIAAAAAMVRPRGHVVTAGLSASGSVGVDLSRLALEEIELHGSGFGPLAGAIERLAKRAIDPSPLVARRIGLSEAAKAPALLAEAGAVAVLVQVSR